MNVDASMITNRSRQYGVDVIDGRTYITAVVTRSRKGTVRIDLNSPVLLSTVQDDAASRISAEVAFRLPASYTVLFYLNYLLKCADQDGVVDHPYTNEDLGAMCGSKGYDAERSIAQLKAMGVIGCARDADGRWITVSLVRWAKRLVQAVVMDMDGEPGRACPIPDSVPCPSVVFGRSVKRAPKTPRTPAATAGADSPAGDAEDLPTVPEAVPAASALPPAVQCGKEWDVGGKAVFGSRPSQEREYMRSKYGESPKDEFISGMAELEEDFVNPCIDPDL